MTNHVIRGNGNRPRPFSAAAREGGNIAFWQSGPLEKLLLPLVDSDGGAAHHQRGLLQRGSSCDANERLPRTTRQYNNAAVRLPPGEELGEAALLIWAEDAITSQADAQ